MRHFLCFRRICLSGLKSQLIDPQYKNSLINILQNEHMNRYFIELSYMGTNYSGFQVQENAKTIQSEVEKGTLRLF